MVVGRQSIFIVDIGIKESIEYNTKWLELQSKIVMFQNVNKHWRAHLERLFGEVIWIGHLERSFGEVIWRSFGEVILRGHLERSFEEVIWRGHLESHLEHAIASLT